MIKVKLPDGTVAKCFNCLYYVAMDFDDRGECANEEVREMSMADEVHVAKNFFCRYFESLKPKRKPNLKVEKPFNPFEI